MPEVKSCKLLQPPRSSEHKHKTKKKIKKATGHSSAAQSTEKPQAVSLPPETSSASLLPPQSPSQPQGQPPKLRATSQKNGESLTGNGRRSKQPHKDSPTLRTVTHKTSGSRTPAQVTELSVQARESLRWEGVLQDPQAEAKRLEQYRANRRQRYIAHREALLKDAQDALRQTFPKESKEKMASTESHQQETASLLHLSTD